MEIPRHRLTIRSSRSGGPGGQNVNKVATKVEVRFRLVDADWIPVAVRGRLHRLQEGRINRAGELVIVSSRHREQARNLDDCLEKLARMIAAAAAPPPPRIATRPTRAARKRRLEAKKRRSRIKESRRPPE